MSCAGYFFQHQYTVDKEKLAEKKPEVKPKC